MTLITKIDQNALKNIDPALTILEINELFPNYKQATLRMWMLRNNVKFAVKEQRWWSEEEIEWLRENGSKFIVPELVTKLCELSGVLRTKKDIRECMRRHGFTLPKEWLNEYGFKKTNTRKLSFKEDFFEVIDTNEKAYILGLFASDGSMNYESVKWTQKDLEMIELIKREFDADTKIYPVTISGGSYYKICFYSYKMILDLGNLGFDSNKSYSCKYPSIPNELHSHFVRGVFDGDGCISRGKVSRKGRTITASILGTLDILVNLLKHSPIETNVTKDKHGEFYYFQTCSEKSIKFLEWIYQDSENLRLERKFKRYVDWQNGEGFYSPDPEVSNQFKY